VSWLVDVLRSYVNACSMPLQGPTSGTLRWVTREQAQRVLEILSERVES